MNMLLASLSQTLCNALFSTVFSQCCIRRSKPATIIFMGVCISVCTFWYINFVMKSNFISSVILCLVYLCFIPCTCIVYFKKYLANKEIQDNIILPYCTLVYIYGLYYKANKLNGQNYSDNQLILFLVQFGNDVTNQNSVMLLVCCGCFVSVCLYSKQNKTTAFTKCIV